MGEADNRSAATIAGSSIIDVRMWFDESPWRIAAGWTVLAAILATGASLESLSARMPTLVLLFLLADPLWGSIWGLMSTPGSFPPLERALGRSQVWLPYLRSGSPAARLFGLDGPSILALIYRVALPCIFLAVAVSLILHPAALWLTLAVIGVSTAGWLHQQVESIPVRLLYVLVAVALPWLLVVVVLGEGAEPTAQLLLAGLWTLHLWAGQLHRTPSLQFFGMVGLGVAQAGMALLFVLLQLPLWLLFLSIFFLPTWLAIYRGHSLERVRFWWMAGMLISGVAVGQLV